MTITRTLAAALVASALAAPAALAKPVDVLRSTPSVRQDLRSADARDAARQPAPKQDLRSADARDAASARNQALTDLRASPVDPEPVTPAPVVSASTGDDGIDWTTIGLGVAVGLLAVSGIAALAQRTRRVHRLRAAA